MKLKERIIATTFVLLVLSGCGVHNDGFVKSSNSEVDSKQMSTMLKRMSDKQYKTAIRPFEEITINDINTKVVKYNKPNTFIYFGRKTCPDCRNFVAKLIGNIPSKMHIYYVDTENLSHNDLMKLSKMDIHSVPTIMYVEKGTLLKKMTLSAFERVVSDG